MILTDAQKNIQNKMIKLLHDYGHEASVDGTYAIISEWFTNKKDLIEMFSKHPNWDAENFRIVFDADYERAFDTNAINEFKYFVLNLFEREILLSNEIKLFNMTYIEYSQYLADTRRKWQAVSAVYDILNLNKSETIDGKDYLEWQLINLEKANRMNYVRRNVADIYDYPSEMKKKPYTERYEKWYPSNLVILLMNTDKLLNKLSECESNILTEEQVNKAKELFPAIRIGAGSTVSKLLRRIFSLPEFKALNEWSDVKVDSWWDENGEYHTREKNVTLETKLTELADKISPFKIKRHTIISLNPLDYLTMSFGHKWASCHTIDIHNYRNCINSYHGEYCSGTLSYMLDGVSIIFYTVDAEYEGNDYDMQDKMQRCVFCLSKDGNTLLQSRVYPDGRDGGDKSLSTQFRTIMQQVVSDCVDAPNHWIVKKGSSACGEYTHSCGTHYRDYTNYDDGNISLRYNTESSVLKIGHSPIDPDTGEEHYETSSLNIDGEDYEVCACCDRRINVNHDNYIYCEDNGNYYCDDDCAERDDVHYCGNDHYGNGYHTEDRCFYDDYDNEWYYGDPDVTTEDEHCFASYENAYNAGYECDYDGYWYPIDEMFRDAYEDCYYHRNDMEVDIDEDHQYSSEDNAEQDGCICVDGTWYIDEDDAYENGCVYVEGNDTWYACAEDAIVDGNHYVEEEDEWMDDEEFEAYGESQIAEELEAETNDNSEESEVA